MVASLFHGRAKGAPYPMPTPVDRPMVFPVYVPTSASPASVRRGHDTLDILEKEGRVVFRYQSDINGSARNIAGITNEAGNVLGMMPHPERAIDKKHGGTDGLALFESLLH